MKDFKHIVDEFGDSNEAKELGSVWEQLEYAKENKEHTAAKYIELQTMIHKARVHKIKRVSMVAASVAAMVVLYFGISHVRQANEGAQTIAFNSEETGVSLPGSNVMLSVDGMNIKLDSKSVIMTQTDSVLSVIAEDGKSIKEVAENKLLTVSVPVGHQFEMVLSDGTKVWLNSDSKLIYPSTFGQNERRVRVIGEAYFDVTHNAKKPFIVSVDGKYDVKVLGTEFNVDSYPESEISRTTLVQGKVKVLFSDDNEVELAPSEQMSIDSLSCVEVGMVNTESFTSWREKRFVFDNERLSDIAVKMKRCYGMDIFVNEQYRDLRFSGRISYNKGVDYFIKVLKETEGIKCQFQSGTLLIGVQK